jgi:hypothetical protein
MNTIRGKVAGLAGAAAAIVLAGCAVSSTHTTGVLLPPTSGPVATQAEQICQQAFGSATLLDWTTGTVADFRAYQYGGPRATVPLAHAFRGVPDSTRGAWCGTKEGAQTTEWWAAVPGHKPGMLITITGPGEGVKHGYVPTVPQVP